MNNRKQPPNAGLVGLLKPYSKLIITLIAFTIFGNALNLVVPRIIANTIDSYGQPTFVLRTVLIVFFLVSHGIFTFAYLQSIVKTYAAESIALYLLTRLLAMISVLDHAYLQ